MKIGLITEGVKDGADQAVCSHLTMMICREANVECQVVCRPLGNLPALKTDCGTTAALLLADGCDRVIILWDLHPGWRTDGEPPCRQEHRKDILASLTTAEVDASRIALVCIEEELEAWLLADHRAVTRFIESKPVRDRRVSISQARSPEHIDKPKTRLDNIVRQYWGRQYADRVHAIQIVQQFPDLRHIRRSVTFQRFELKVKGNTL